MNNVFNELEYLSNPSFYEKYIAQQKILNDEEFKNDKKFYRKRIIQLTKDLYSNDIEKYNIPLTEIKKIFNKYVKESIDLLKLIDKNDNIQEEYNDLSLNKIINNQDTSFNLIDNDSVLFNKPATNKIEDCMPLIKKSNNKDKNMKIPIKKDLNLKDPKLKTKGVKKKE
tara:strand:+ start:1004 stop:1510 length:507 start_codon:yes stop_codon:yes gene_type:complete